MAWPVGHSIHSVANDRALGELKGRVVENLKSSALELVSDPLTNHGMAFGEGHLSELGLRGLLDRAARGGWLP